MFKRALVSVSDKSGLIDFLRPIVQKGCEVVSTGGTSKFLREANIPVTEVSEATGFPEIMDGRVRTLHPKIHMALLARSFVKADMELLKANGVQAFDLVVVNLYPFEESLLKGMKGQELIEQIDIGGPSLLRAASKSFERITVVSDPEDYRQVTEALLNGTLDKGFRQRQAAKAFSHCSFYDSLVSRALTESNAWENSKYFNIGLRKRAHLRYGENPHQSAMWYENPFPEPLSLNRARQIQGKDLSYNNILDLEAAVGAVSDFSDPCAVIIKHLTPCGVAIAATIEEAYHRAFEGDPVSAFGGIIALNRTLTLSLAESLVKPFLECVVAPQIDPEAQKLFLNKKPNLRVMEFAELGSDSRSSTPQLEFRSLRGGALVQTTDSPSDWKSTWKVLGGTPTSDQKADMVFAQKVVRHVKSNAIVVVKNLQTLGVCGGQTNRVDSVKMALARAHEKNSKSGLVMGSDAFFPFRDSIDIAFRQGVSWIIQPGGSLRDAEVELAVQEHNIGMVVTGTRHFKH